MATLSTPALLSTAPAPGVEPLVNGDRLTRHEFERRYEAMPHVKKAELIEGIVYMPSPVSYEQHGEQHGALITWFGVYSAATPGVRSGVESTVRLDLDNEPQPDGVVFLDPTRGGQVQLVDGYIERAPELVAEVSASSVSIDLHAKLNAYRRNGVREYLVWRVRQSALDWFVLRNGQFDRLTPTPAGLLQSEIFPGLWLDATALLRLDLATVLRVLQQGLASAEHDAFVARLNP